MADKKHIIRSQGSIDFSGNTTISSTNELRVNDDQIIINADQAANNSTLVFRRNAGSNGSISWDGTEFTFVGNMSSSLFNGITTDSLAEGSNNKYFSTSGAAVNTTNLPEGTNLYYTTTRANTDFDTRLATKDTGDLAEGSNLYYTDARARAAISENSTQLSYDNSTGVLTYTQGDTDTVSEGSSNLYFTNARARLSLSASGGLLTYNNTSGVYGLTSSTVRNQFTAGAGLTYDSSSGEYRITNTAVTAGDYGSATAIPTFTSNSKGQLTAAANVNIAIPSSQVTDFETAVEALFSVTDTGGDGSLSYSNGVFTYTGPSATEVRAHISGGDGIDFASGVIDVDNTVVRTSGNQSIAGNKTFTGDVIATTQAANDSSTKVATTAYVQAELTALLNGADPALDTLGEIAAALGNNANIAGVVTNNTGNITALQNRNINSGAGISGGGNLTADRTLAVDLTDTTVFTSTNTASKAVVRDGSGDFAAGTITATSFSGAVSSSQWNIGEDIVPKINNEGNIGSATKYVDDIYSNDGYIKTLHGNTATFTGLTPGTPTTGGIRLNDTDLNIYTSGTSSTRAQIGFYNEADFSNASATTGTEISGTSSTLFIGSGSSVNMFYNRDTGEANSAINFVNARGTNSPVLSLTTNGLSTVQNLRLLDSSNASIAQIDPAQSSGNIATARAAGTLDGMIFYDGENIKGIANSSIVTLSAVDAFSLANSNSGTESSTTKNIMRRVGNDHFNKQITAGSNLTITSSTDAVTLDVNIPQIRTEFSVTDNGGDGSLSYNNNTGVFTYSGISDSQIRSKLSATGNIDYDSSTGVISESLDTSDLTESTNLFFTNARARGAISVSGSGISYDSGTGVITLNEIGDISQVNAGDGLSGGGSSGNVSLAVDSTVVRTTGTQTIAGAKTFSSSATFSDSIVGPSSGVLFNSSGKLQSATISDLTTTNLAEGTNLYYTDSRADTRATLRITAADIGNLNNVNGGTPSTGDFLLYDGSEFGLVTFSTEVNTYADARIAAASIQDLSDVVGSGVDTLANGDTLLYDSSNSRFNLINLGSEINSYFDTRLATKNTGDLAEGTNLYYTNARVDSHVNVSSASANEVLQWSGTDYQWVSMSTGPQGLTGLQGDKGQKGEVGAQGATGPQGAQGPQGATGPQGSKGQKGEVGAQGPQGVAGPQGQKGATGATGPTGPQGNQGNVGPQGATGDKGATGAQGLQGDQGAQGPQGDKGANGATGPQGTKGQKGELGPQGATGPSGDPFPGGTFSGDITVRNIIATGPSGSYDIGTSSVKFDNIYANTFNGTATSAQYADLAENYQADKNYAPGTVVEFGGSAEVQAVSKENSPAIAGVVSTEPAHLMNAGLEGDGVVAVALRGRVPCKVYGPVRKGDVLIASSKPGLAKAAPFRGYQTPAVCIIGKAINEFTGMGEGVVEILV